MAEHWVELADPSSEGRQIADYLRAQQFEVRHHTARELPRARRGTVLVVAADEPEYLEALKAVRRSARGADVPVIVVGDVNTDERETLAALEVTAQYARPVSLKEITTAVLQHHPPPDAAVEGAGPWGPRETTQELEGAQESPYEESSAVEAPAEGEVAARTGALRVASSRLQKLLLDADRRVFPTEASLEVQFPAHEESARELVPNELLEMVSLPLEPVRDDALDSLTFAGTSSVEPIRAEEEDAADSGPRWIPWGAPPSNDSESAEPSGAVLSQPERRHDDEPENTETRVAGSTSFRSGYRGDDATVAFHRPAPHEGGVGVGDVLRILWHAAGGTTRTAVELQVGALSPLRLDVFRGEVLTFEGPAAPRVVARLARDGRATPPDATWTDAERWLDRKVRGGQLGRLELDRLLRLERVAMLQEAVSAEQGRYRVQALPAPARVTRFVLGVPLRAALLEAARRRFDADRVLALWGDRPWVIRVQRDIWWEQLRGAMLEPEIVALVERHDGVRVSELFEAVGLDEGLPGVVLAMVVAGAVRLVEATGRKPVASADPAVAITAVLRGASALAREGDYFSILGLSPDAGLRAVRAAWRARRQELEALSLEAHGLHELEPERREAVAAVDEAWEVLRDNRIRELYRRAVCAESAE